jgi:hypothetical protein
MNEGDVNKLETGVQILELFQGADLVLLTEIWHFLDIAGGLLFTFVTTLAQTYHSGRRETTIPIYGYGSIGVLPLTYLYAWCMLPLLAPNTRANPCSKN